MGRIIKSIAWSLQYASTKRQYRQIAKELASPHRSGQAFSDDHWKSRAHALDDSPSRAWIRGSTTTSNTASRLFAKSVLAVDTAAHTATFVLHHGTANGKSVWYIQTDASDAGVAKARGLNFAPGIASGAIARAKTSAGSVVSPGAPDSSPARTYVTRAISRAAL